MVDELPFDPDVAAFELTADIRDVKIETFEKLMAVIRIQSSVINDLFLLLCQRMDADEADSLPVVEKINEAAAIMKEVGW